VSDSPTRKKIAILGGGVGAVTAAFELTSEKDWRDRYEVTLYQIGWRLGGKGASGRNSKMAQRIEEHGLHFWLGFYENAFRMIRKCYAENQRPLTHPLATWEEAFKPFNEIVVEEHINERWIPWLLQFTPNPDTPGDSIELPSVWEMLGTAVTFLRNLHSEAVLPEENTADKGALAAALEHLWVEVKDECELLSLDSGRAILRAAEIHVRKTTATGGHDDPKNHAFLLRLLERYESWLSQGLARNERSVEESAINNDQQRRLWIITEFIVVNVRGMVVDGVLIDGFSAIENYDYVEWLQRHGATALLYDSAIVRAFYDLSFSKYATVAAGTYLKGMLRVLFTYRGAVYWKMQAGMGDVIFAPMYEVLRKRGVKIKFFHKVTALHLSDDRRSVGKIDVARQAAVKSGEYEPLVDVKLLPCWPSEPLYDQLLEGDEIKKRQVNLESYWADWNDVEQLTLVKGKDFDEVVFGISLGSVPILCQELIREGPEWEAMVRQVQTAPTQAFQTWFRPDIAGMGWRSWQEEPPLVTAFTEPMDTFADMSHLMMREDWTSSSVPGAIGYFCGPMKDPGIPPPSNHKFPGEQLDDAYRTSLEFMNQSCLTLLTNAKSPGGGFDFNLLVDPNNGSGNARFKSQYFRVNIDPSERYVLSVKGSTQHRLRSAASGFDNLYLAGDWTSNGVNAGCVEAAAISGIQAAAGILGRPSQAFAEDFGEKKTAKIPDVP
jgi:uncharacterized protein with NAD-binding domain and iron-sulfur cluster